MDPSDRAVCGISSGGICAFTVAWERPDQFGKVLSHIGSFTNIRGGWAYPGFVRKTKNQPKPLKVYLQEGKDDLNNLHGNWPLGNQDLAAALQFAGYHYRLVMTDGGHSGKWGGEDLPDALRWLWSEDSEPTHIPDRGNQAQVGTASGCRPTRGCPAWHGRTDAALGIEDLRRHDPRLVDLCSGTVQGRRTGCLDDLSGWRTDARCQRSVADSGGLRQSYRPGRHAPHDCRLHQSGKRQEQTEAEQSALQPELRIRQPGRSVRPLSAGRDSFRRWRSDIASRHDPEMRAIGGSSSGAICAFTAAWERPDVFRKVYSSVGSFTNLRGGNIYPALVRKTEPKPIRVYMADTSGDIDNAFGSWPWANQRMASALKYMGYDTRFDWAEGYAHNADFGSSRFPDAMKWLWRNESYKPEYDTRGDLGGDLTLLKLLIPGEPWEVVADNLGFADAFCTDAEGNFYFCDMRAPAVYRIDASDGARTRIAEEAVSGMKLGSDGLLYACQGAKNRVVSIDVKTGSVSVVANGVTPNDLAVTND